MKTKIAFISDIHGNLEALKTVIKDIQNRDIDKIICLGDIIGKGINSKECIDLIQKHCFVTVGGNADYFFSNDACLNQLEGLEKERFLWNQALLNEEHKQFLLSQPLTYEFYMSGLLIRLFHATPFSDHSTIFNLDPVTTKIKQFEPSTKTSSQNMADVVLYGHIHNQFMEKLYCRTLINVGSVGNSLDFIRDENLDSDSKEIIQAHYVIMEGDYLSTEASSINFEFVSIPYDINKELERLQENLEPNEYKIELKRGIYREMHNILVHKKN